MSIRHSVLKELVTVSDNQKPINASRMNIQGNSSDTSKSKYKLKEVQEIPSTNKQE